MHAHKNSFSMYHGHGEQGIYEAARIQLYCRYSKPGYTAFNCNLTNHNKTEE